MLSVSALIQICNYVLYFYVLYDTNFYYLRKQNKLSNWKIKAKVKSIKIKIKALCLPKLFLKYKSIDLIRYLYFCYLYHLCRHLKKYK